MTLPCFLHVFVPYLHPRDRHVLTGSYHNYFRIFDVDTLNDVVLQADKSAFKAKKIGGHLPGNKPGVKNGPRAGGLRDAMQLETLDFNKKILHASWHPRENTIAVRVEVSYLANTPLIRPSYRSPRRTTYSCSPRPDDALSLSLRLFRAPGRVVVASGM